MNKEIYLNRETVDSINWFYEDRRSNKEGYLRMPPSAYQLLINGLEYVRSDVHDEERQTIRNAIAICEYLRDKEKFGD